MNPQSSDSGTTANLPAITQLRYWDRHSWEKEMTTSSCIHMPMSLLIDCWSHCEVQNTGTYP
jgi:hypothetical protein